jgi:hypothetical protein
MKEIANGHSLESEFPDNPTLVERAYRVGQTVVRGAKSLLDTTLQVDHNSPLSARLHNVRKRNSRSFIPDPTFSSRMDEDLFESMAYIGDPGDVHPREYLKTA